MLSLSKDTFTTCIVWLSKQKEFSSNFGELVIKLPACDRKTTFKTNTLYSNMDNVILKLQVHLFENIRANSGDA